MFLFLQPCHGEINNSDYIASSDGTITEYCKVKLSVTGCGGPQGFVTSRLSHFLDQ
jgi:hypothetical protein